MSRCCSLFSLVTRKSLMPHLSDGLARSASRSGRAGTLDSSTTHHSSRNYQQVAIQSVARQVAPVTLQAPKRIPRKTSLNSDALTGEWLVPGSPRYAVRMPTHRARPRYLEPGHGEPLSAPLTLHRSQQEGAVGLEYSLMMAAYLSAVVQELRAEQRAVDRAELAEAMAWWTTDYGVTRVQTGLRGKMPATLIPHVLEVVLTCHREHAEPSEIAKRFNTSVAWVYSKIDLCMRIAGYHSVTCACTPCVVRRKQQRVQEHEEPRQQAESA